MGTDVHMIGEVKGWSDKYEAFTIPDKFTNRNYAFFAAIGNVRNGFGFAGCELFKPIEPISDCRGLPVDASKATIALYNGVGEGLYNSWLGDHSLSYITLDELKAYKNPVITHYGVMPLDAFLKWDKVTRPKSCSGSVFGGKTQTVDQAIAEDIEPSSDIDWYVKVSWDEPLLNEDFINDFITYLEQYGSNVRIIFGFDS